MYGSTSSPKPIRTAARMSSFFQRTIIGASMPRLCRRGALAQEAELRFADRHPVAVLGVLPLDTNGIHEHAVGAAAVLDGHFLFVALESRVLPTHEMREDTNLAFGTAPDRHFGSVDDVFVERITRQAHEHGNVSSALGRWRRRRLFRVDARGVRGVRRGFFGDADVTERRDPFAQVL